MNPTPFHAYYKARTLETLGGKDRLIPAYASSDIEVYPYQVTAAAFAIRSPYLKGAILCDDVSLGKSIEAMLIITQRWYEGKRRILIIVPTPLLYQWTSIIDSRFSLPLFSIDSNSAFTERIKDGEVNPFDQDGIVITTYDFTAEKAETIAQIPWDLTVFEEAHHLRKIYSGDNKSVNAIHAATINSFKLLLTATPMQNDIMDLYGLIYFIDETALPDADSFYKRYFRKPENYPELASQVSRFCFRTTRPQVASYVKIPERISVTFDYTLSEPEQKLSALLNTYLARNQKYAFPKMEFYDLTLMLFRTLSSSTFALTRTLRGMEDRLSKLAEECDDAVLAEELSLVRAMRELSGSITENAKGVHLLAALKKGIAELRRLGANRKAIIFTENRETQKHLYALLNEGGYKGKVLTFNGEQSRDYTVMERFERDADILITTDIAAEGFNLEFCSFVVNYDLPYNTLTIEQRIGRCHRQGQQSAVVVVNFLNRNNFADVRLLELINKRILQFDGIIGLSDDVIGSLNADVNRDFGKTLAAARTKDEIDCAFAKTLSHHEDENKQLVKTAEETLFTVFDSSVTDNMVIPPRYIEQRVQEVSDDLWMLTKNFFEDFNRKNNDCFDIGVDAQTVTARTESLPDLFYYWSGSRNRPYRSLRRYGISRDFKPASGRITLSSVIGRGVLQEISCADCGTITVDADTPPCMIGLYCVSVRRKDDISADYITFVGMTDSGKVLSDAECREFMALPVCGFTEEGNRKARWLRESIIHWQTHELDRLVLPDEFIRRTISDTDNAVKEEIGRLRLVTADHKAGLEQSMDALRREIGALSGELERAGSIAEKLQAEKRKASAQKELKQREQQLFLDGMRLDLELEEQIRRLTDEAQFTVDARRQFVIRVEGIV